MRKTLLLTMRGVSNLVAYSHLYEFEDVVAKALHADMIELIHSNKMETYRKIYKAIKRSTGSGKLAHCVTHTSLSKTLRNEVEQEYDLLIAPFNTPYELPMLFALGDWRNKIKKAACYIVEFWEHDLPKCRYLLDLLKDFDHIFLGTRQCVEVVERITGKPCSYLPLSIDSARFCPQSINSSRPIEFCNLGRRSSTIHAGLMHLATQEKLFYYYDTISISNVANASKQQTFAVKNPQEHRLLLANILTRSGFFIANRARANEFEKEKKKDELSSRFFEGAAAGTIMLGEPPNTKDFHENFDWPDAVIEVPFDSREIENIVLELKSQSNRLKVARINNVKNSLLRHDSIYRLQAIFNLLGLEVTPEMEARENKLKSLADTYTDSLEAVYVG